MKSLKEIITLRLKDWLLSLVCGSEIEMKLKHLKKYVLTLARTKVFWRQVVKNYQLREDPLLRHKLLRASN